MFGIGAWQRGSGVQRAVLSGWMNVARRNLLRRSAAAVTPTDDAASAHEAAAGAATDGGVADEDSRQLRGRVLRLAWPSIVENLLQSVLGIVTILMVARLGSSEVAAVGASQQIQILFISAFFSLSMGAGDGAGGARLRGAQQHDRINDAARPSTSLERCLRAVDSLWRSSIWCCPSRCCG